MALSLKRRDDLMGIVAAACDMGPPTSRQMGTFVSEVRAGKDWKKVEEIIALIEQEKTRLNELKERLRKMASGRSLTAKAVKDLLQTTNINVGRKPVLVAQYNKEKDSVKVRAQSGGWSNGEEDVIATFHVKRDPKLVAIYEEAETEMSLAVNEREAANAVRTALKKAKEARSKGRRKKA